MNLFWKQLFVSTNATEPLFKSQRELARLLCDARGLPTDKMVNTSAFISQMVNGERPLPEAWKPQLRTIIDARARELGVRSVPFDSRDQGGSEENDCRVESLVCAQVGARDVLILNACPLELTDVRAERPDAERLQSMVAGALSAGRRYHYCVADRTSAARLWISLARMAEGVGGDVACTLRDWIGAGTVRVSVVPELLLLHPTVAFDVGSPDRLKAFVWHAPYDWERCLPVPDRQVAGWYGSVRRALDDHAESIPFPS